MILLEFGPRGLPALFDAPRRLIRAERPDEVLPALEALDRAQRDGFWAAGFLSYEAPNTEAWKRPALDVAREALETTEHGGLMFGPAGRAMMKGETPVLIAEPPVKRTQRASRADRAAANPVGDPLFDALRAMRRELAAEAGVPPYVIFHDAVLRAMASERPATRSALADIPGVGGKKLDAWGDAFLNVIRQY